MGGAVKTFVIGVSARSENPTSYCGSNIRRPNKRKTVVTYYNIGTKQDKMNDRYNSGDGGTREKNERKARRMPKDHADTGISKGGEIDYGHNRWSRRLPNLDV
jgi:hypothetical protein